MVVYSLINPGDPGTTSARAKSGFMFSTLNLSTFKVDTSVARVYNMAKKPITNHSGNGSLSFLSLHKEPG